MFYEIILYTPMYITFFWSIILLLTGYQKNPAKFFLGFFMLMAFFVYMSHAIFFHGTHQSYLYIDPIYTFASLMVYPMYYVYIRILTEDGTFKRKNLRFFFPAFFLGGLTLLIYLLMPEQERIKYVEKYFFHNGIFKNNQLSNIQRMLYFTGRIVFTLQVFYFLIKGSGLIKKYNQRIANFYSDTEKKSITWAELLLQSFVITSLMSIFLNAMGKNIFLESHFLLIIPSVIFSVLLFIIGWQGAMQNYTVNDFINDQTVMPEMILSDTEKLKKKLFEIFEQKKVYHNPNLKITDLSLALFTNRTYLSRLINQEYNLSFSDFVNKYRIQEAKILLKNQPEYTLEYIAEEVGFGSLHSFIRVFKKFEGLTPGKFRRGFFVNKSLKR